MSVKASLKIVLMANEVEIAESDDPLLWQNVFAAISQGGNPLQGMPIKQSAGMPPAEPPPASPVSQGRSDPVSKFAAELGIKSEEVEGALGPTHEEPYIQLDPHCWEALKKNTPPRGAQAISPVVLAGTVLALWFKHAGIDGIPTTKQSQAVLRTIHLRDANAARSLKNAEWLQTRGNGIVINPAQRSRAIALAVAYCTKSAVPPS